MSWTPPPHGTPMFAIVDQPHAVPTRRHQMTLYGTFTRRESNLVVLDMTLDARRGVTRRIRVHVRFTGRSWS